MPVRFNKGGDFHDREEYSFRTGDYGARDFARMRRFGDDENDDSRTMSLVSSPLQVPLIGKRRSVSPAYRNSPVPQISHFDADDDLDDEISNAQRRNRRQSLESNRRRYDYRNYDDYDDEPLEPLVPTYQPRPGRSSQRSNKDRYLSPARYPQRRQQQQQFDEEFEDVPRQQQFRGYQQLQHQYGREEPRQAPQRRQEQEDEEVENRWRKRTTNDGPHADDLGYVVPPMRKRTDPLLQEEEENLRSVTSYLAKRKQFAVEDDEDMHLYRNPNYQYRMIGGAERPVITNRDVEESIDRSKLDKAPMFDMKLRSHMVWEKMNVKFTCTVRGHPLPRVTWYKDMVPLEPSLQDPGKFKISKNYGLHTLEICRTSIDDSGTYRVSVQNRKGEMSSYATLLVRRYDGGKTGFVDMKSGYNLKKPTDFPDVEGMNIPDKKPHTGRIMVQEYDDLPESDARRRFRDQLENLDFDVNKLIKEAKLVKDLSSHRAVDVTDDVTAEASSTSKPIVTFAEEVTIPAKENNEGGQISLSTIEASAVISAPEMKSDVIKAELVKQDSNDSIELTGLKKDRFKVAVEVKVTNDARRFSMDVVEKVIDPEPTEIKSEA